MDEELGSILENAELTNEAKQEAIKALVGKNFVSNEQYNKANAKTKAQTEAYNSLKTEYDAFKESKMSDEEKQAEIAKIQAEENKKMKLQLNEMTARNIFSEAGFSKEDYDDLLKNIVQEDAEKTKNLAQTICNTMTKQKADIEKAVKDKIIKNQTPPPAGNDNNSGSGNELENYKKLFEEAKSKNDFPKMAYYTRLVQEAQMEQNKI